MKGKLNSRILKRNEVKNHLHRQRKTFDLIKVVFYLFVLRLFGEKITNEDD